MTAAEYRAAREALGLTQEELAERLGVHPMTVSKRERGVVPISREAELAVECLSRCRGLLVH